MTTATTTQDPHYAGGPTEEGESAQQNFYTQPPHSFSKPAGDTTTLVTRQELTQVVVAIVTHYEKQIGELQQTCQTLASQMTQMMNLFMQTNVSGGGQSGRQLSTGRITQKNDENLNPQYSQLYEEKLRNDQAAASYVNGMQPPTVSIFKQGVGSSIVQAIQNRVQQKSMPPQQQQHILQDIANVIQQRSTQSVTHQALQKEILSQLEKLGVQQQPLSSGKQAEGQPSMSDIKMSKLSMFNNTQYLYSPTLTENGTIPINYPNNQNFLGTNANLFGNVKGLSTVQHTASSQHHPNFIASPDSEAAATANMLMMSGLVNLSNGVVEDQQVVKRNLQQAISQCSSSQLYSQENLGQIDYGVEEELQMNSPISIEAKVESNLSQSSHRPSRSANNKKALKPSSINQGKQQLKPQRGGGGGAHPNQYQPHNGTTLNANLSILLEEDSLQQQMSVSNQNPTFTTIGHNTVLGGNEAISERNNQLQQNKGLTVNSATSTLDARGQFSQNDKNSNKERLSVNSGGQSGKSLERQQNNNSSSLVRSKVQPISTNSSNQVRTLQSGKSVNTTSQSQLQYQIGSDPRLRNLNQGMTLLSTSSSKTNLQGNPQKQAAGYLDQQQPISQQPVKVKSKGKSSRGGAGKSAGALVPRSSNKSAQLSKSILNTTVLSSQVALPAANFSQSTKGDFSTNLSAISNHNNQAPLTHYTSQPKIANVSGSSVAQDGKQQQQQTKQSLNQQLSQVQVVQNGRSKTPSVAQANLPKSISNNSTFGYNPHLQQAIHTSNLDLSKSSIGGLLEGTGKMPSFSDSNPHSDREHHHNENLHFENSAEATQQEILLYGNQPQITMRDLEMITVTQSQAHSHKQSLTHQGVCQILSHHGGNDISTAKTQSVRHFGNVFEETTASEKHCQEILGNANSQTTASNRGLPASEPQTQHQSMRGEQISIRQSQPIISGTAHSLENGTTGRVGHCSLIASNRLIILNQPKPMSEDNSQEHRELQPAHSQTDLLLGVGSGLNNDKRKGIGRVNHEMRLNNLVQTIQKYKDETITINRHTPTGMQPVNLLMGVSSQATLELQGLTQGCQSQSELIQFNIFKSYDNNNNGLPGNQGDSTSNLGTETKCQPPMNSERIEIVVQQPHASRPDLSQIREGQIQLMEIESNAKKNREANEESQHYKSQQSSQQDHAFHKKSAASLDSFQNHERDLSLPPKTEELESSQNMSNDNRCGPANNYNSIQSRNQYGTNPSQVPNSRQGAAATNQVQNSEYFSFSKQGRSSSGVGKSSSGGIIRSSENCSAQQLQAQIMHQRVGGVKDFEESKVVSGALIDEIGGSRYSSKNSSLRLSETNNNLQVAFKQTRLNHPSHHSNRSAGVSNQSHQSFQQVNGRMSRQSMDLATSRARFDHMTGDILDLIAEYLPPHPKQQYSNQQVPPLFVFCSITVLRSYCEYKRENLGIQVEILIDQIGELKRELFEYFDQKLFKMSKNLSIIYHSNIVSKEWQTLEDLSREHQLGKDDQTLIRVYLILLGQNQNASNLTSAEVQDRLASLIAVNRQRLNQIFNPEFHFTFGPQNLCQVGQLLQSFQLESYIINYSKQVPCPPSRRIRTLQIMAQIVYEALQFCKIVPNRIEKDIRELEHAIDLYSQLQDRCDRHNAIIGVPIPSGTGGSNMGTQEDTIENGSQY